MKIKLTHLIIASIISLNIVFSAISNAQARQYQTASASGFSRSRNEADKIKGHLQSASGFTKNAVKKATTKEYQTTSASGFNEGPITQKNLNGGIYIEQYDPQQHEKKLALDLKLDMERVGYNQVKVTVKNISLRAYPVGTLFYIKFILAYGNTPGTVWAQPYLLPLPNQEITFNIMLDSDYWADPWILWACANSEGKPYSIPEPNKDNNCAKVCRDDEDCS